MTVLTPTVPAVSWSAVSSRDLRAVLAWEPREPAVAPTKCRYALDLLRLDDGDEVVWAEETEQGLVIEFETSA